MQTQQHLSSKLEFFLEYLATIDKMPETYFLMKFQDFITEAKKKKLN